MFLYVGGAIRRKGVELLVEAYREAFEHFKAAQEKDEAKAPPPEGVARLVAKVLSLSSPRPRYTVGLLGQRIVVPLKRFLPGKLFEAVVGAALGV
jgi:hypothetical protein